MNLTNLKRSSFFKSNTNMTAYLPVIIILLIGIFSFIQPRFFTLSNFINLSRQSSFLMILASGQAIVCLTTGVDLSCGAVIAIVSVISSLIAKQYGVLIGMSCGIIAGIVIGLINGLSVSILKAQSFAITLGAMSYLHGLALILSNGRSIGGVPSSYRILGTGYVFGLPIPTLIASIVVFLIYFLLNKTVFGRHIYAVGGNLEAARLSGINVKFTLTMAYVLCSALSALGGVLMSSRINSGQPNLGLSLGLECIAAVVLGGITWRGGEGKYVGVIFGVLLLGILSNGFDLIGVSSFIKMVITGIIIVIAVDIDSYSRKVKN